MKKRFLSLILATMMVFSLLSTTAFASEPAGTNEQPISEDELPTMDIPLLTVESTDLEYTNGDFNLSRGEKSLLTLPTYQPQQAQMPQLKNLLDTCPPRVNISMFCSPWSRGRYSTPH